MVNKIFKSEKESRRFNMNILRATMHSFDVQELNDEILKANADLTVLRLPCEDLAQVSKLELMGFPFFQADTLVYYDCDFEKHTPLGLKNTDLFFIKATIAEKEKLAQMVDVIFPGYTNHYNSNSFIDKKNIVEGYKEWALDFLEQDNKYVFIVARNGQGIGFITCSVAGEEAEIVLNGVMPEASGGGVYTDIIRYLQSFLINLDIKILKVSTQVHNYAVQKVWNREGFVLSKAFATIHINSFLNYSLLPEIRLELFISHDDIKNFAEGAGSLNSTLSNNLVLNQCVFLQRVTQELIAHSELWHSYGVEFVGIQVYSYKLLSPLYPDQDYKVLVTVPFIDENKKIYKCLVKIYDKDNKLCFLVSGDFNK